VLAYDALVQQHNAVLDIQEEREAINVMHACEQSADARRMIYEIDEEGRFTHWVEEATEDGINDEINPFGVCKNMVQTLAHFMNNHNPVQYSDAMMKTLSKQGHMIVLPSGNKYVGGSEVSEKEDQLQNH